MLYIGFVLNAMLIYNNEVCSNPLYFLKKIFNDRYNTIEVACWLNEMELFGQIRVDILAGESK